MAETAEDENGEREDVPALDAEAGIPDLFHGDGLAAEAERPPGETEDRSGGRSAEEIGLERPGLIAGETAEAGAGDAAEEIWKDGPVWTVRGSAPEIEAARRLAQAERLDAGENEPQTARADGPAAFAELGGGTALTAGLEGLYRQAVQAARPAPALPPEQAVRQIRAQEPGSAAALAVDELDRAVRRDSRRYDGGMTIY